MKITINDNYYVEYDKYNFTPFKWVKGGEVLSGKHKGEVTEDRWVNTRKYFGSMPAVIRFITLDSITDENDTIMLNEFLVKYEERMKELIEACKGV